VSPGRKEGTPSDRSQARLEKVECDLAPRTFSRQVGKVCFFVMVGHSFGFVSAVDYNRRSAAITDVLRRISLVVAFNFYDEKYWFGHMLVRLRRRAEGPHIIDHDWGRSSTRRSCNSAPIPRSSASRTTRHAAEDQAIKKGGAGERDRLHPRLSIFPTGSGRKLCGKLMFGASQLWGKIGTAFL
jgi:hypothetical protein